MTLSRPDKVQSLKEGASGYVTKPFVIDTLVERLERVLRSPRVEQATGGPGPWGVR